MEKGELMKKVAAEFNVGTSTVSDSVKSKAKLVNLTKKELVTLTHQKSLKLVSMR